jgi:alkylation response protein AidB-like acyl-CoA dehydrogenase
VNVLFCQSYKEQATKLAGQIAFLKMYSTRCAQDTARDAVQVFGGRGITQTGMGRFVEHVSRFLVVWLRWSLNLLHCA